MTFTYTYAQVDVRLLVSASVLILREGERGPASIVGPHTTAEADATSPAFRLHRFLYRSSAPERDTDTREKNVAAEGRRVERRVERRRAVMTFYLPLQEEVEEPKLSILAEAHINPSPFPRFPPTALLACMGRGYLFS